MSPARSPIQDQVAIVGVGTAPYSRGGRPRSSPALALEACRRAIVDAGLTAADVDGIAGTATTVPFWQVQGALGIPETTWGTNHPGGLPIGFQLVDAANAVFSGACRYAVVYHSAVHPPGKRRSSADPLRVRAQASARSGSFSWVTPDPPGMLTTGGAGYAAWAWRYMQEFGLTRDQLARIAVNNRTHAVPNPNAVMRTPLTVDDYLAAPMVYDPLCLLDLDVGVDGAEAFVLARVERAADTPHRPVLLHAATTGRTAFAREDQLEGFGRLGPDVAMRALWERSDLALGDVDLFYPFDGFSFVSVLWLEAAGFCGPGEAGSCLDEAWRPDEGHLLLDGRVPVNTHGGNLSEGATQGAGALREAVVQLRGDAGDRQVDGAEVALVAPGGIVWNAAAALLRTP